MSSSSDREETDAHGSNDDGGPDSLKCCLCGSGALQLVPDLRLLAGPRGLRAHHLCLLFSSGLHQRGEDDEGLAGFLPQDIQQEMRRGRRLKCVYCKHKGATVGCARTQCKKSYHLPCGMRQGSLQQHFDQFKSFCPIHRPAQKVASSGRQRERRHKNNSSEKSCGVCLKSLDVRPSFSVLWTPCCGGWLHRDCAQKTALSAGRHHFRCTYCNDGNRFVLEMRHMGICLPDRPASWERPGEVNHSLPLRLSCTAKICFNQLERKDGSREHDVSDSLWEVLPCEGCGSKGIHVRCGGLQDFVDPDWYCYTCRRVVSLDKQKICKPINTIWGSAKGTKDGVTLRSSESQRKEMFHLVENITVAEVRGRDLSPVAAPKQDRQSSVSAKVDAMNVTLEDIIINGLNQEYNRSDAEKQRCKRERSGKQKASPGDSDYESAQENAMGATPSKICRAEARRARESFDETIQRSIKDLFHT